MTAPLLAPSNAMVAVELLKLCPDVPDGKVATTLPSFESWVDTGFIQVTGPAGGGPDVHMQTRRPLMQVDCWAARRNSQKPDYGRANDLAEGLIQWLLARDTRARGPVPLPGAYRGGVLIHAALPRTEPRQISDPSGWARFSFDMQLFWSAGVIG